MVKLKDTLKIKLQKKGIQLVKKKVPEYSCDTLKKWKLHYEVESSMKKKYN